MPTVNSDDLAIGDWLNGKRKGHSTDDRNHTCFGDCVSAVSSMR
jgi:hypothetical protein